MKWPAAIWLVPMGGALALAGVLVATIGDGDHVEAAEAVPAATPDAGAPAPPRNTVRIIFQTNPPQKAEVRWGKKLLGVTRGSRGPLVIERPRDSGPMDVVIRASGYIPVNTRAYTFNDSRVTVKLTRTTDKHTVLGYRIEVPPDGGSGDGGVPITASSPSSTMDGGR